MANEALIWILGTVVFMATVVAMLYCCCHRVAKERDRNIFHLIQEQTRLARELEHARIENRTLEKILQNRQDIPEAGDRPIAKTVYTGNNEQTD